MAPASPCLAKTDAKSSPPERMVPVGPASLSIVAIRGPDRSDARLELLNYRPDGPVLDAPD